MVWEGLRTGNGVDDNYKSMIEAKEFLTKIFCTEGTNAIKVIKWQLLKNYGIVIIFKYNNKIYEFNNPFEYNISGFYLFKECSDKKRTD